MCGRIALAAAIADLRDRFDATPTPAAEAAVPQYNAAPTDRVVTVTNDAPDTMDAYTWGFVPAWADDPDDGPTPINARSETVHESRLFRDAFEQRRCLVLADGFYEWRGDRGSKQPYRICRADGAPFAYAGLWSHWTDGHRDRRTVAVLTTTANSVVEPIHDRMPAILAPDEEATWLHGDPSDARRVLDPAPADPLDAYPVSTRVNDPANDDPGLLAPVDRGTQAGLDDFGA